ncbi:hypothetical protein E5163_07920 [Marinicauda algicola]|uniref:Uncharacterized protein n=1 Tax=Marinicauda algicola TaxID=2029849 RepID=A0A4S2H0M3_9PROT|nr:hypothetical protein [Marinicauda algicola]TGY89046.1 hypothetical protein E5163_07920 [Marinicauda algicola]
MGADRPDPDEIEALEGEAIARLADRRGAHGPAREVVLAADRLEVIEAGRVVHRLALGNVKSVRLSVDMAGPDTQVVARICGPATEIAIGSRSYVAPGRWANNAVEFRRLVLELHRALRGREVRYLEGHTLGLRLVLCALGAAMALAGLLFAFYMAEVRQSGMLALAALPFMVIGGYLAWVFRPGVPVAYDPEQLIERFEKSEADAAAKAPDI